MLYDETTAHAVLRRPLHPDRRVRRGERRRHRRAGDRGRGHLPAVVARPDERRHACAGSPSSTSRRWRSCTARRSPATAGPRSSTSPTTSTAAEPPPDAPLFPSSRNRTGKHGVAPRVGARAAGPQRSEDRRTGSRGDRTPCGSADQTSMTTGTIIGRRLVRSLMNLPAAGARRAASVSKSVAPFGDASLTASRTASRASSRRSSASGA